MAKDIHVVPDGDGWAVKAENRKTALETAGTKEAAVKKARRHARQRDTDYVMHRADGTIEDHRTPRKATRSRERVVHVMKHEEHWDVRTGGGHVVSRHASKFNAIGDGKQHARADACELVVHRADGEVQRRFDPRTEYYPTLALLGA